MEKLQDDLHQQCSSKTTRVLLKSWKDSPQDLAQRIWRRQPEGHKPAIVIIGYSYGGNTAAILAAELDKRGLPIDNLLLVDAVWRPWRHLPSFLSLFSWWAIDVPDNVKTLHSWRQTRNKPNGHHLNVSKKTVHHKLKLDVTHQYADDHSSVREIAMRVACPGVAA